MIAIDIMGGDFAPDASLKGALKAAQKQVPVLLSGPKFQLIKLLDDLDPFWTKYPIQFIDTNEVIEMGEEPVRAITRKPNSSLVMAVKSVKAGTAQAVISAGNSGALMVAATFILGCEDGIERPAIMSFLPGIKNRVLSLDLGANPDCKPLYLKQFACMGSQYLEKQGVLKPRIGLLCNGSEPSKGSLLIKDAHKLLKESELNFIGNIEPIDIINNLVDIVVCDGLSGNILLKAMEATARMFIEVAKESSILTSEEKKKFINLIVNKANGASYGGAQLLGVKGTVVVAHGAADANAIENAIIVIWESIVKHTPKQSNVENCLV